MCSRQTCSDCVMLSCYHATHEHKVAKESGNVDWETCQNKYADILERFKEQYPADDAAYPHSKDDITKIIITTKIK